MCCNEYDFKNKVLNSIENFKWEKDALREEVEQNPLFLAQLFSLHNLILKKIKGISEISNEQVLKITYDSIFDYTLNKNTIFEVFFEESLRDIMYDTCLYVLICIFLHSTKKKKGIPISKFIINNRDRLDVKNIDEQFLKSEDARIRQIRKRILSNRNVYINEKGNEWNSISQDSEVDWGYMYWLNDPDKEKILDTFKRFRTLLNPINELIHTDIGSLSIELINNKSQKFDSKLRKIKYTDYLNLCKNILLYSSAEDKIKHFGTNIYKFENTMLPSTTVYAVGEYLKCKSKEEADEVARKSVQLKEIAFPKLYKEFFDYDEISRERGADSFLAFREHVVITGCLLLDTIIDEGYFGDNWFDCLLEMSNEKARHIFYDPKKRIKEINSIIKDIYSNNIKNTETKYQANESEDLFQEAFIRILGAQGYCCIDSLCKQVQERHCDE